MSLLENGVAVVTGGVRGIGRALATRDQKMSEVPMLRAGEVDEIASVALVVASDLSSYMTGTVVEVTGGRFM
jgi:NAD(P)-dependent dehydrogenase (short-subunit alcohol dehydrogenase family)